MTATACHRCGTELRASARFCDACGSAVARTPDVAEYKHVTVLFLDLVRSMQMADQLGAERLREVLTQLVDRAGHVVQRYGGTVDKFTGDGLMALFGAPIAMEDHALRACLAAQDIQRAASRLSEETEQRDDVRLQIRVGLNSGQVIAGRFGSDLLTYTAVGRHVGMAQRMEAAAPPGGVMISESTARLVEHAAVLGPPELVHVKNVDEPVPARRLDRIDPDRRPITRVESKFVGRHWEVGAMDGLLDRAVQGQGSVACVVGPPGIGKSRLVREAAASAAERGVDVFWGFCDSHAGEVPFHLVTRLLRSAFALTELDDQAARLQLRARAPDADEQDLLLFDDLLGIADPAVELPKIDPGARRRRLTALVNASQLKRSRPAVYVIEDVHWIDDVSDSMLADFLAVVPRTPTLVLVTYRPEYRGRITSIAGTQIISLLPLHDSEISVLITDLLGVDPSVQGLQRAIVSRSSGNPFFAQEIVRDFIERDVLHGQRGAYRSVEDAAEVTVPATLQTTIAARIDRLDPAAKQTLSAAAVIGLRFSTLLLADLIAEPEVADLLSAELLEQVQFTQPEEYVFHHPLIRAVAYESQLKSGRADLHRRLAAAIERRWPESLDKNAAVVAEHLEAAGDLHAAYGWHMRAGWWSLNRDILAARLSWESACAAADALPADDPARTSMQIAPRTLLCLTAWRVHVSIFGVPFDELRQLCEKADDKASLAMGMAGLVMEHANRAQLRDASALVAEYMAVIDSIGDPNLTVGLSFAAIQTKAETDELSDLIRWADTVIDLAEGDPTRGNIVIGSPLATAMAARGFARWGQGDPQWRDDFDHALEIARQADALSHSIVIGYNYLATIVAGVLLPTDKVLHDIDEALQIVQRTGDDFGLAMVKCSLGFALVNRDDAIERQRGFEVLGDVRQMCVEGSYTLTELPVIDVFRAREWARAGDVDGALTVMRAAFDDVFRTGVVGWCNPTTRILVETLVSRGTEADLREAEIAVDRLEAGPRHAGLAMRHTVVLRCRALIAQARGDDARYVDLLDGYRTAAADHRYQGHAAWAAAMPSVSVTNR
ncbi:AAA family ATPase [Mycobacterium manitobense]|uniref:AAA family ATPase n=1 Tax=[Mycobacterium] manitobense TaxID=190147 RepID=A0A9X3BUI9_9MYCO|nr:adenylate/guanylate cyclase domain-containing protein [[Mycobacterium] manitobense]MCV7169516.1 AAA family ATPase [[Mycobacterium] manitobense]